MKKLAIFLFFSCLSHFSFAGIDFIDVDDFSTWEKILQLAKKENRNLFVQVIAMPCTDCRAFKRTTLKDKEISEEVNTNFLAIKIYNYSEVGRALKTQYSLQSQTSILVINTNEIMFFKGEGLIDAPTLKRELNAAKIKIAQYPTWQKGAAAGNLEPLDWVSFLLIDAQNNIVRSNNPIITDVCGLLDSADLNKPEVQKFISTLAISVDNPIFQTLKKHPSWMQESKDFTWQKYLGDVYNYNVNQAIIAKDSIFLEDIIYQFQQLPETLIIPNMALKSRQLYLAELGKWNAYDTITKTYLFAFPADSANRYQEEAIFLMENYKENKPNSLALQYLQLGLRQKETFDLYYTLSLYLYTKDELLDAYKAGYRAWEISKNSTEAEMAVRLLRTIDDWY